MRISVTDAEGQLAKLVRLAETGDDVVLTREGEADVRLVPIEEKPRPSAADKMAALDRFLNRMAWKPIAETEGATRSHDFLYDENGLPG
ncbi:type II toxin-antitoxin system prevent-host-death family antitoxin [soil metagenome]